MKKLFTFLFAVMASISTTFAFTANDEIPTPEPCSTISGTCGKNLSWELTCDGVLTISGTGAMSDWKNASDVPWYSQSKSIKSVVLNDGVTSIGRIAFLNCISLTSVAIPNSVTSIALAAFQGCSALTAVTIPNNVTKIEDYAFYECTGLSSMSVESGNTKYDSRNNCNAIIETASNILICGCRNTTIPNSVKVIGNRAFHSCTGLSSINIPNGVTSIGEFAFHFCTGLTSITIPNSVTSIGDYAFQYCTGLTSITCEALTPPSGSAMFVVVDKSIPLYVPAESVNAYKANSEWNDFTNILPIGGEDPFIPIGIDTYTCKVTPSENSAEFEWSVISDVDSYQLILKDKEDQTKCILNLNSEGKLIDIAFYAPSHNRVPRKNETSNLSYIVTGLESGTTYYYTLTAKDDKNGIIKTFEGSFSTLGATPEPCSTLSGSCGDNLTWELSCDSVLTVSGSGSMWRLTEEQAWRPNKVRIKTVILPEGLDSISPNAFYQCINLTSVNMPNNVRAVGHKAFVGCDKLTEPVYNERIFAFLPARYGDTYSVPEGIVSIAAYANSIVLPTEESVAIGVSEIVLPSTLKRLGMYSLGYLLKKITCYATTPPVCNTGVFGYYLEDIGVTLTIDKTIPVYVPAESVDAYKAADGWKDFTNILPIGGEDPFIPVGTSLTVTEAIAKGKTLEIGAKTTIEYTITGYVSAITDGYDEKNGIQSFWIADENILANSNESGALYIYRGKVSKELAFGNKVSVQAYITNYNGMIETYIGGVVTILNDEESVPDLISGICGEEGDGTNLTWQLNTKTGTLEIKGAGKMASLVEKIAGAPENLGWHYFRPYIRKVILPAELTKIGNHAFYQCENLESVVIPDKVDTIGKYAFTGCVKLTQINMPESVRALGANAFYGTSVTDPVYNSKIFGYMPKSYEGKYVVPEGIVSIATRSFVNCGKLTEIIMPESLKRLGTDVFDGCGALQSLTCYAVNPPECVHTFTGIDMSIPLYVPAESVEAYKNADQWKEFENILPIEVIPEPNKYIITFLNDDGTKLDQREWVEGETPTCKEPTKEDDDYIYCFKGWNPKIVPVTETATYQAEYDVCGGWLAGNIQWRIYKDTLIVSGNGVIPDYEQGAAPWLPFSNRIKGIRVAKGITRIGEWAFVDMTPTRVQIARDVTVMGANAFKGSSTIDKVVFDGYDYEWAEINFVNEYSNPLYYGASFNYQVLHINATTKTISTGAFVGFSTVVYHGTLEQWCSMTFTSDYHPSYDLQFDDVVITEICPGEGLTKISAHAFQGCRSIERVCIPISLKQIGQDAFKNMPNLKTVTYAGDLKQWSAITFANSEANPACHADLYFGDIKLGTRLDIPDSVTVINPFVFPNTKTLNVYFHHMDPAGYELNSFGEPDQVGDKHFYVPCGTKDAYQKRLNYSEELFEEYFHYNYEVVSADEQKGKVSILHVPTCDEPQLEILATPNQGFRFVEWSDGSTEAQRSLTLESDTVLEASFDLDSVMIRFLLDDSTLVLEKMFKYGTLPECADPVKEPTAQYTFTFLNWKPEIKVALKDTTYIAVFDSVVNAYMVYFINWNGVLLAEQEVEYGSAAVAPEVPARENYQFVGWNVDINSIVGRTFAVAQFEKEESQGEYTIHYHNTVDDTEIAGETIDLHFPEPPEIEGFVFVGWQAVCDEFIVEGMEIQAVYEPLVPQSAEQVVVNPSNPAQKLFRNGTVYVLQDEKVYTVTGQTVK